MWNQSNNPYNLDSCYSQLEDMRQWRSNQANILLQIDQEFEVITGVTHVLDLCAAPGSWSEVIWHKLTSVLGVDPALVKIVAVDLKEMDPLPGVTQLIGDITTIETAQYIIDEFKGSQCDIVFFDGYPVRTGVWKLEEVCYAQLLFAAHNIATHVLKQGGSFIGKICTGKEVTNILNLLNKIFQDVTITRIQYPGKRYDDSYVVCKGYYPPRGYRPTLHIPFSLPINVGSSASCSPSNISAIGDFEELKSGNF